MTKFKLVAFNLVPWQLATLQEMTTVEVREINGQLHVYVLAEDFEVAIQALTLARKPKSLSQYAASLLPKPLVK